MERRYLRATKMLDYEHPTLRALVERRQWRALPSHERIGAVYAFVRDEVAFGYNAGDDIPASQVLADGYGHCNTKTTLLMALLRASGEACRFHGATIRKALQKGVLNGLFLTLAPKEIVHTWAEVLAGTAWKALEGVILDASYLQGVRKTIQKMEGAYTGFAVGTNDLANPPVDWNGNDTYIQQTGMQRDFGTFDDPDAFYGRYGASVSGPKALIYRLWVRRVMNANVAKIRARGELGTSCPL